MLEWLVVEGNRCFWQLKGNGRAFTNFLVCRKTLNNVIQLHWLKTKWTFGYSWKDFSAASNFWQWVSCTVHRTHKPLFSAKNSLKMSPTALFIHLKIILLQYFQFSVFSFSKISSIQTDPKKRRKLI